MKQKLSEVEKELNNLKKSSASPTWTAMLPAILILLEQGFPEDRKTAKRQLLRMAELADLRTVDIFKETSEANKL